MTTQLTTLQAALTSAQSSETITRKRYCYLFALGPFGLIGLAAALALYQKWESEVNSYQSQISLLNAQITSVNSMQSACTLMGADLQGIVSKLSDVSNSLDFLASEILAIHSDLNTGASLQVIGIKVNAASTEVTTLGIDAS